MAVLSRTPTTYHLAPVSSSFQSDSGDVIPLRHVGDDDAVADGQALQNFNGVHRGASELHIHARRILAIFADLEQADGAFLRAVGRASDVQHVGQSLELDRTV